MKKFWQNNKQLLSEIGIFSLLLLVLWIAMRYKGFTLGHNVGDFLDQHFRFVDYLRNSFWATGDLFPQVTFNFGGTSSAASLFYHGQYNPLIMLSYLFKSISTLTWLQIMYFIIVVSTFSSMNILLRRFEIRRDINLVVSVLAAFSPVLFHHFSLHIMFTYYYPLIILSFIALDILLKDNKKWLFIICIGLIFYTNFFFALVIGFTQVLFFGSSLFYRYTLTNKEKIKKIRDLIFSYLIGILLGMMVFLPQALQTIGGERSNNGNPELSLFSFDQINYLTSDPYGIGFGIIIILTLLIGLFNLKNKFTRYIILALALVVVCDYANYLLNIFQYVHPKAYVYLAPLFLLLFALFLNDEQIKYKKPLTIISLGIAGYLYYTNYMSSIKIDTYLLTIIFQTIIVLLIIFKDFKFKKLLLSISVSLCVLTSIAYATVFTNVKDFKNDIMIAKQIKPNFVNEEQFGFYRINNKLNFVGAINEFSPFFYASIMNDDYINFYNEFLKIEKNKYNRDMQNLALDNLLFANILGINETRLSKDSRDITMIRPFIYGVEDKNIYSLSSLEKQDYYERLIALNKGFFTNDGLNEYSNTTNYKTTFYEGKDNIKSKEAIKFTIDVPKQFQRKGIIMVEGEAINDKLKNARVSVNKNSTIIRPVNRYLEAENRSVIIYLNSSEKLKELNIRIAKSANEYTPLKISFIDYEKLAQDSLQYVNPDNIDIQYNKSYNFSLNMEQSGYLGTSIFYDEGFIIKVDGKVVPNEKVNHNFLGAKLEKGSHDISIEYQIKGFKEGIILTVIGCFALGLIMVNEIKWLNRPFFRFVIVGAFNTVNYFIAYTLLLLIAPYLVSHVLGFIYSAFVSYFLTAYYTFNTKPSMKTFVAFPLTFLPNLVMSSAGTAFIVELGLLDKSIASLVVMIMIIPVTFIINKLIFKKKEE